VSSALLIFKFRNEVQDSKEHERSLFGKRTRGCTKNRATNELQKFGRRVNSVTVVSV
jgi:hypothetical protein